MNKKYLYIITLILFLGLNTICYGQTDIPGLDELDEAPAAGDELHIIDKSDTPPADGTDKKITISNLMAYITSIYVAIADIDDSPVNGETTAPISSNWAFDHENGADPHTEYMLESNIGTGANNYLQLNGSGQIPAVSGELVTNVNAITGDSATAFFSSGTIEKARGGTGADNSSVTFPSSGTIPVTTEVPLDSDFGSNGLMERTGPGTYDIATEGTDYNTTLTTGYTTDQDDYVVAKTASKRRELVEIDLDADRTLLLSETNAIDGDVITLVIIDATYTADMDTVAGRQTLKAGPFYGSEGASIEFVYATDEWVETGRSTNIAGFDTLLTTKIDAIPVEYMKDGTSAPGALTVEDNIYYRDFASDSTEDVQFVWYAPEDLAVNADCTASGIPYACCTGSGTGTCNTIKVRPKAVVTNATTPANTEGVSWGISACSFGTNDTHDCTLGTEVYSEDSDLDNDAGTQWDVIEFPWVEVTPTDLAKGESVAIGVNRDHDNVDDDYLQDIGLFVLEIAYQSANNTVFGDL